MQLVFRSFSVDDDDYRGYDYSLIGRLLELPGARCVQNDFYWLHGNKNDMRAVHLGMLAVQGSVPITNLPKTSSEPGDVETEVVTNSNAMDLLKMERMFITGILDELKICFSYSH
ncbi:hypothetical protein NE237_030556 [Protea cynaroides]|uniref:Uncharacterized protein n=1 Tax=Protea cynaroides TaxID=273540 RepID=A0A9Q0GY33_9MAGN|nr:hypothetical protein NE237_030556 [Protea cynaroides]